MLSPVLRDPAGPPWFKGMVPYDARTCQFPKLLPTKKEHPPAGFRLDGQVGFMQHAEVGFVRFYVSRGRSQEHKAYFGGVFCRSFLISIHTTEPTFHWRADVSSSASGVRVLLLPERFSLIDAAAVTFNFTRFCQSRKHVGQPCGINTLSFKLCLDISCRHGLIVLENT